MLDRFAMRIKNQDKLLKTASNDDCKKQHKGVHLSIVLNRMPIFRIKISLNDL